MAAQRRQHLIAKGIDILRRDTIVGTVFLRGLLRIDEARGGYMNDRGTDDGVEWKRSKPTTTVVV